MDAPHAVEPDVPTPGQAGRRRWLRFVPLAIVLLGLAVALALGAPHYLTLETLREQRALLNAFVARHPYESVAAYVGLYILVVAFSIPGALVMTLAGGFLFGLVEGTIAATIGVTAGAVIMFLVARSAVGDLIRARFPEGGRIRRIEARIRGRAFSYLFTLRLIPAMPLWLVNIAAGFVHMPLRTYFLATFIGIIPSTAIYASIGAGLGRIFDRGGAIGPSLALDPWIGGPILALVLLSLAPFGVHLYRRRRTLPRASG